MVIETFAKIENKDLLEIFSVHSEIDDLGKGFIVLGYLINKIIYAQTKDKKSSTFMNRIKLDGYDKNDLVELLNDVKEYFEIYKKDIFNEDAENSFMNEIIITYLDDKNKIIFPEKISTYIIFGIELGKYIGKRRAKINKEQLEINQEINEVEKND